MLSSIITYVKQLLENSYLQMIKGIGTPCDYLQNRRELYFSAIFSENNKESNEFKAV